MDPIMLDEINTRIEEVKAIAEIAAQQAANSTGKINRINTLATVMPETFSAIRSYGTSGYDHVLLEIENVIFTNHGETPDYPYLEYKVVGSSIKNPNGYVKILTGYFLFQICGENGIVVDSIERAVNINIPELTTNAFPIDSGKLTVPTNIKISKLIIKTRCVYPSGIGGTFNFSVSPQYCQARTLLN